MPCKATLADLVESLAENMSVVELAQTAIRVEISKTIREARKQLNLSQKELAEKMGVKQSIPLGKRRMQLYDRYSCADR